MAKVPTARSQGIGTRVRQPTPLPYESASTNVDMFGGVQARQAGQLGKALSEASAQFEQAQKVIQNREDAIARSREYGQFFSEMSDEFDRVQAESDMTSSQTIADYNQLLESASEQYLSAHAGRSPESYARLAQKIEETKTKFSATLTNNVRKEQRAFITNQFEDQYRGLADQVASGEISLEAARLQSDAYLADIDPALPNSEVMGLQDAAEQQLSISALNRFSNAGEFEALAEFMASNPAIVASLPSNIAQVYVDKVQQARAIEVKERAEVAAQERLYREALGIPSNADLPLPYRFLARGLTPPKSAAPLSDAGKAAHDRMWLVKQFGEKSPEVLLFDRMNDKRPKPESPLGKMLTDLDRAKQQGDSGAVKALEAKIKGEHPNYEREQELRQSFATVQGAASRETRNLELLGTNIGKILAKATGVQYEGVDRETFIDEVKKRISQDDFALSVTGPVGKAASWYPGSDAAEAEEMLKQVQGHVAFDALKRMREASPTGGALGNVSNFEIERLQAQEGALNLIYAPKATTETLLSTFQSIPGTVRDIRNAFNHDYSLVLEGEGGGKLEDVRGNETEPPIDLTTQPSAARRSPETPPEESSAVGVANDSDPLSLQPLEGLSGEPVTVQLDMISRLIDGENISVADIDELQDYLEAMNIPDENLKQSSEIYRKLTGALKKIEGSL